MEQQERDLTTFGQLFNNFDLVVWFSSKQQYFLPAPFSSRVANWPPKFIGLPFLPWGQVKAI